MKRFHGSFVTVTLLALVGCGGSDAPPPAATVVRSTAAQKNAGVHDAVAAVRSGSATLPLELRFVLSGKPVVGQQVQVNLQLAAKQPMSIVRVLVSSESLTLDEASSHASLSLAEAGASASHTIVVTPTAAGLAELKVTLDAGESGSVDYALPLLAVAAAP
jgi:hypothetical protein